MQIMELTKRIFLALIAVTALFYFYNKLQDDPLDNITTSIQTEELPLAFIEFYKRFHSDSIYQLNHIRFPLAGQIYDDQNGPLDKRWLKSNWKQHTQPSNNHDMYETTYEVFHNIIEENIRTRSLPFSMSRRFAKMDTAYYLIYYKEMGPS